MDLRDQAEIAVRDIITTLESGEPGSDEAKIADLYASFMDEDAVEAAGAAPAAAATSPRSTRSPTPEQLAGLLGRFTRRAISGLVGVETESDPGDPNRYVMFAGQGGIGLPDEAYYRQEEHAEIRAQYRDHLVRCFELAGLADAAEQAALVFALETEIAATHWDKVKTRDLRLMYNLTRLDDFAAAAPGPALADLHGRRGHRRVGDERAGRHAAVVLQ